MDQQKEKPVQTYAVKQKDTMAEGVYSKEAPKNPKVKKQRRKTNLKHRTNISAVSKGLMKTKKWRKSPILGKQRYKTQNCRKRNQGILKDKQRIKRRNSRRKRKQLGKRSKQNVYEVKNRNPIPARVLPTKKHKKLLIYGKRVYSKRSKIHGKKKIGKDEERKSKTHGTKERRSKYSRGRTKLKVSMHWTKQKCHSARQRNDDDDDDEDYDDDESVSDVAWSISYKISNLFLIYRHT